MPNVKTKFKKSWLENKDGNGHIVGKWLKEEDSPYSAKCTLCSRSIRCDNSGFKQILKHADGDGHKAIAHQRFSKDQVHFSKTQKPGTIVLPSRCQNDQVAVAEAAWSMKVAASNYSYNSCEGLSQLFKFMFPCPYTNDFSLGRNKVSYNISDGLGPYFLQQLCKSVQDENNPFTLQFDETVTAQNKKQLDLMLRVWSEKKGEVITRFLKALMFGHAKGKDVSEAIISTMNELGLSEEQFLSVGSDGPNVNKTIWRLLDEHLKGLQLPGLVDFMPCNVHVVHNGFKHGLPTYGQDAEQLALDVFYWFKAHPARKEDFFAEQSEIGFDEQLFIRHVQSRWLTLLPALMRIVHNWEPLRAYFLIEVPKMAREDRTDKALENNTVYKRVCQALQGKDVLIQIHFLISIKVLFDRILGMFQRQEPLIHILHDECLQLVKKILLRFMKTEVTDKSCRDLAALDVRQTDLQLLDNQMEIGEETRRVLSSIPHDQRKRPLKGMRSFLQETAKYLLTHLPIADTFLRDLTVLHPMIQHSDAAVRCIRRVAQKLPQITRQEDIPSVVDEWKLYQQQEITDEWWCTPDDGESHPRIDHFWGKVLGMKTLAGTEKFPHLKKVIKAVLCLSHGNADVERSLSINKQAIGTNRTLLTPESINGIRLVKDAVLAEGGKIHDMDFNKDLLSSTKGANEVYRQRLEQKKKEEEALKKAAEKRTDDAERQNRLAVERAQFEEKKRKLKDTEKVLEGQQKDLQNKLKVAESLFSEANLKLATAMKSKDFNRMSVAQALLEVAHKKTKTAQQEMEAWNKERATVDRKRMKMVNSASHHNT